MSDGMIGTSHVTIPDLLEPVVGFRTFRVIRGQPAKEALDQEATKAYLVSPTYEDNIWDPGVNKAGCAIGNGHRPPTRSPVNTCQCGFYSYYTGKYVPVGGLTIFGIVTSWGKIEAHPTGMRSEFMQIHALWGGRILKDLGAEWEDVLQFDIQHYTREEFIAMASEFGSSIPEEMRPKPEEEKSVELLDQFVRFGAYTIDTNGMRHYRNHSTLHNSRVVMAVDPATFPKRGSVFYYLDPILDPIGRKRVKLKFKWPYWLICLLMMTNWLWTPRVFGGATPSRSTPPAHIRQCNPSQDIFKGPLSVSVNCLLRPMESPDG